jgi:hypothetical protein
MFAYCVAFYFGMLFENYKSRANFWDIFFQGTYKYILYMWLGVYLELAIISLNKYLFSLVAIRVTRLGEFSSFCRLVTLDSFFKLQKYPKYFGYFCHGKSYWILMNKTVWANFLGNFFISSGHPGGHPVDQSNRNFFKMWQYCRRSLLAFSSS